VCVSESERYADGCLQIFNSSEDNTALTLISPSLQFPSLLHCNFEISREKSEKRFFKNKLFSSELNFVLGSVVRSEIEEGDHAAARQENKRILDCVS